MSLSVRMTSVLCFLVVSLTACGGSSPGECDSCVTQESELPCGPTSGCYPEEPTDPPPGPTAVYMNGSFEENATWTLGSGYSIATTPSTATHGYRSLRFDGVAGPRSATSPSFTVSPGRAYAITAKALSPYNSVRINVQWFASAGGRLDGGDGVVVFASSYCLAWSVDCYRPGSGQVTAPYGAARAKVEVLSSPGMYSGYASYTDDVTVTAL